jgi:hypothetical protein
MSDLKVKLQKTPQYKIKVSQTDGLLQTFSPLTLKNILNSRIKNIEDIQNISVVNKTDGSILQFNSTTNDYEIKLGSFDGGEF